MTTRIRTNLNRYSEGYANAQPRLQAGLDNIAADHGAAQTITLVEYKRSAMAHVEVKYMSGALLRDVVAYLDEMQILD